METVTAPLTASSSSPGSAGEGPLCVDLDGTLIASDLLYESCLRLARQKPLDVVRVPFWLAGGKANLKRKLAERIELNAAALPYREEVIELLRKEKARGRRLVLVTASDARLANAVAEHLALFDEVIGSDGVYNVKGENKLKLLKERFPDGFDYVGDSAADLHVWKCCGKAYTVALSGSLAKRARAICTPTELCTSEAGVAYRLKGVVKVLRPHQWVKNVLLFLPLILAHILPWQGQAAMSKWLTVAAAFMAFSFTASSVYVVNDLLDVEADRLHPKKRRRAFASGRLPITWGPPLLLALLAVVAGICVFLPVKFVLWLGIYLMLSTAYSFHLKTKLLVDIIVLAGLYTLRIIAGGHAVDVELSKWLLAFSMFLFVSLAFAKRYTELVMVEQGGGRIAKGRNYHVQDLRIIEAVGPTSGYLAVMVMALYINDASSASGKLYQNGIFLWMLCPLMMYWITRVWFYARRGILHDDPIVFAIKDRVSWAALLLAGLFVVLASVKLPLK